MDDSYLTYPKRDYGQDHEFYDWRMAKDRPHLAWDSGAKIAISFIIPVEYFPLNPSGAPFKHPGAMVTPYPDLRHFTVRDYGNRVGVFRILEAFKQAGVKGSFAINGEIAKRYPPLLKAVESAGHDIIAHGLSTDHIHYEDMSEVEEATVISETLQCFDVKPSGWLSPARGQTSRTLSLLGKAGLSYNLDWEMDSVPVSAQTDNGKITLIPNSYELSDFTLLHTRKQTEDAWQKQILDAVEYLAGEHERFGAQCLGVTLTPYVIGQPFRIKALRDLLTQIKARGDASVMTTGQIDTQFRAQI